MMDAEGLGGWIFLRTLSCYWTITAVVLGRICWRGVRVSASGRRFQITGAQVWNLLDAVGAVVGQAAMFADWEALD